MLVHCASEIAQLAANAEGHLILVLLVARLWPAPLQGAGEQPPEAQATYSDGIVADHHAMEGLDGFDVTQVEAGTVLQADRMLDHLSREVEAALETGGSCHAWHGVTAPPDPPD